MRLVLLCCACRRDANTRTHTRARAVSVALRTLLTVGVSLSVCVCVLDLWFGCEGWSCARCRDANTVLWTHAHVSSLPPGQVSRKAPDPWVAALGRFDIGNAACVLLGRPVMLAEASFASLPC